VVHGARGGMANLLVPGAVPLYRKLCVPAVSESSIGTGAVLLIAHQSLCHQASRLLSLSAINVHRVMNTDLCLCVCVCVCVCV